MRLDKVDVLEQKLDQINKTLPTIESEISTMKVNITEVEEGLNSVNIDVAKKKCAWNRRQTWQSLKL